MYSLAIHRTLDLGDIHLKVAEAGSGRPLVFFHGLGWTHSLWAPAFERYASRFRVIAGDTRGHGESGKPPGPYSIDLFAGDWSRALDLLDVKDPILVGFSQGGMIAQQLAVGAPSRVAGLFLAATTCRSAAASAGNMDARIQAMREEGPEASARIAVRAVFSEDFIAAHPEAIDQFVRWRAAADAEGLIASMLAARGFDVHSGLAAITCPRSVVAGARDTLTPPERVAELAAALGVPMHIIDGVGHMMQVEAPDRFYALLDAFLAQWQ